MLIIVILTMVASAVGCGKDKKSSPDKPVISFPRKPDLENGGIRRDVEFKIADEACQQSPAGSDTLDAFKPLGLFNGQLVREDFVWAGGQSRDSLATSFIGETRFDYHQRLKCSYQAGKLNCEKLSAAELVSEGQKLRVCNPSIEFSRNSLESIGLTSLAGLDRANQFYESIRGRESSMPTARLLIMPKFEKQVTVKRDNGTTAVKTLYDSDNLAYAASLRGVPSFIVYPKGETSAEMGLWKNYSLWESRWVFGHEFGHHVFRNIARAIGGSTTSRLLEREIKIISLKRESSEPLDTSFGLAIDSNKLVKVFDAINEGFSDLFGHYANGMSSPGMYELDCFKENRDVNSPRYSDGTPKAITDKMIGILFGEVANDYEEDIRCTKPDFEDIHAVGATVAHGIHQLMGDAGVPAEAHTRGLKLIAWAEEMVADINALRVATEEEFFAMMIVSLLKAVDLQSDRHAAVCSRLTAVFPALRDDVVSGASLSCR